MARELAARGFEDVHALQGGFDAWVGAGLPLEPPTTAQLTQRPQ